MHASAPTLTPVDLVRRHRGCVRHMPRLGSLDLQDEHVVRVVVGDKAGRLRWRDVGVDARRVVQLDLDGVGQRGDRAQVPLEPIDDEGVAVGQAVAHAGRVQTAVVGAVGRPVLVLAGHHQPHGRRFRLHMRQERVDGRGPGQQAVEVARPAAPDVVGSARPDLVEKGVDTEGLQHPG